MEILVMGYALRIISTSSSSFFSDIFFPRRVLNRIGMLAATFALLNSSLGIRPHSLWLLIIRTARTYNMKKTLGG